MVCCGLFQDPCRHLASAVTPAFRYWEHLLVGKSAAGCFFAQNSHTPKWQADGMGIRFDCAGGGGALSLGAAQMAPVGCGMVDELQHDFPELPCGCLFIHGGRMGQLGLCHLRTSRFGQSGR